jgi:hypothetical protein
MTQETRADNMSVDILADMLLPIIKQQVAEGIKYSPEMRLYNQYQIYLRIK